jgi:hypothetical protein
MKEKNQNKITNRLKLLISIKPVLNTNAMGQGTSSFFVNPYDNEKKNVGWNNVFVFGCCM